MAARRQKRQTLTRMELARALACNPRTIAKWQEEGLPVAAHGRGGRASRYDEIDVRAWLAAREEAAKEPGALDWSQERARKEHWQALVAQQLYETRAGKLLPALEVEKAMSAERDAVRTKILATYTTQADRVHRASTLEGLPGVERALKEVAYEVLRELAGEAPKPVRRKRRGRAA